MANPIQHAERAIENTYAEIQPYIPAIFKRLALNYALLLGAVLLINIIVLNVFAAIFPLAISTLNVVSFGAMLLLIVFGWRYLENRNQATGLFVLYTYYSRQRRDLRSLIVQAEEQNLEDEDALYLGVDTLEQVTKTFLEAAEEQNLEASVPTT